MKRFVKVNSEITGESREKSSSKRGFSSKERPLSWGNSVTPLHISSISEATPSVSDLPDQSFDDCGNSRLARGAVFGIGAWLLLTKSILKNHLVNNIPAGNTSPSKKHFGCAVEFFQDHYTTASLTLHLNPPKNIYYNTFLAISIPKRPIFVKILLVYWLERMENGLDISENGQKLEFGKNKEPGPVWQCRFGLLMALPCQRSPVIQKVWKN